MNRRESKAPSDGLFLLLVSASATEAMRGLPEKLSRFLRPGDEVGVVQDGRLSIHVEAAGSDIPHIVSRLERCGADAGVCLSVEIAECERIAINDDVGGVQLDEIARAIQDREMQLHYQPQICLGTGRLVGAEALLRWNTQHSGLVMPGDFIPFVENTWVMSLIDEWVLNAAGEQIRRWVDRGANPVKVSVNVSATRLGQSLVDQLKHILQETRIPPHLIEIEITETAIAQDVQCAAEIMRAIEAMGVRLSIDDFGTGYSCFSSLMKFPVHTLKLDRSFVSNLHVSDTNRDISAAILTMARQLGLYTVGEGVEIIDQRKQLSVLGCDAFQGFLFSPAVPAKQFEHFLLPHTRPLNLKPAGAGAPSVIPVLQTT